MDVDALIAHICVDSPNITFYSQELLPSEVEKQSDPLIIIVNINNIGIRCTLIDVGSTLNKCSIDLSPKINIDPSSLNASSIGIHGFDNVSRQALGMIVLTLRLGPITIPTLVYVLSKKIPYNLLLGRSWIHAMDVVPSTLNKSINFIYNNRVVTIRANPEAMHLCKMVAIG